jgi:hypothetical protein
MTVREGARFQGLRETSRRSVIHGNAAGDAVSPPGALVVLKGHANPALDTTSIIAGERSNMREFL